MKTLRLCVALSLLVLINCSDLSVKPETLDDGEKGPEDATIEAPTADTEILKQVSHPEKSPDLPILPPIILLDFANDNSTSPDEKSKRTIDNNLGYGYLKNNLLNGKYNYYFPGGKTGTTVSIEESISPFEPKTIIEQFKPITDKPAYASTTYQPSAKQAQDQQNHQQRPNYVLNHQIFGQRTKLQKYSPPDHYSAQGFSPAKANIAYTTIRPDYTKNQQTTPNPRTVYTDQGYQTRPIYDSYATTQSPSYDQTYNQRPYDAASSRPLSSDPSAFNIPKYTIENGVRYENKIVWRYRDGSIASPPSSYMTSYSEYVNPQKAMYQVGVSRNPGQDSRYQDPPYDRYPEGHSSQNYQNQEQNGNTIANIHNQRPAQFPNDQESRYGQYPNTLNSAGSGGNSQSQNYDLSYQQKYGFRPQASRYEPVRQASRYSVDTSNPEYSTPATPTSSATGQVTSNLLSKYSPQAQKYLSKVFAQGSPSKMKEYSQEQYSNAPNYENLLSYNPSISQYIRNPSSILNAQPTFIQAGNSLIPVIILRVDGAPPARPPAPSINLKALLQQYLSQYAEGIKSSKYKGADSLNELTQLAHALSRLSPKQEGSQPIQKLANHPLDYESTRYHDKTSYDTAHLHVDRAGSSYGSRMPTKQKVKSVQIIGES